MEANLVLPENKIVEANFVIQVNMIEDFAPALTLPLVSKKHGVQYKTYGISVESNIAL